MIHVPTRAVVFAATHAFLTLAVALPSSGQSLPAFSGADGAGALATGGRGGLVYHVTKLDQNYGDSGPGTLRYGLNDNNFKDGNGQVQARTIVFDVGGTFWLGRYGADRGHDNGWDSQSRLNLGSNVTIAGQTAPGGGVTIMGGVVKANGSNVILRNVTIAPGYGLRGFAKPDEGIEPTPGNFPDSYTYDAIDISGQNIIVDHVSTFYATDETISMSETADEVTVQYSNISLAQNYPQADAEASGLRYTGHALGSLIQPGSDANISVHHNLYAHQKGRLPRVGSEEGTGAFNDFRNNVFYNWLGTAGTGASGQPSFNNFVANFYLAGDGGEDPVGGTSTDITTRDGGTSIFDGNDSNLTRVFHAGNVKDINKDGDAEDTIALSDSDYRESDLQNAAYTQTPYRGVTDTAAEAYERVLNYMGANWWTRDGVIDTLDERIINDVRSGTGTIQAWADDPFNDDSSEGEAWRQLLALRADTATGAAPFTRAADYDTDGDGMPDAWEVKHGLNPNVADNNGDFDSDGYTNLEEYINDLAAMPAPTPLVFGGSGNGRYAEIANWGDGVWQPSRFDEVVISEGAATVDAVGQHAGALLIAGDGPGGAELRITDGWLRVETGVQVGGESEAGTLTLTGGALITPLVDVADGGDFSMTGGTLATALVTAGLTNDGGTLAPGNSIGGLHVEGDLTLNSGILEIELSDTGIDQLLIDGQLKAGGILSVVLLDDMLPDPGERWLFAEASSIIGKFDAITPGFAVEQDSGQLYLVAVPEPTALMLLGPAVLGWCGRRRHNSIA